MGSLLVPQARSFAPHFEVMPMSVLKRLNSTFATSVESSGDLLSRGPLLTSTSPSLLRLDSGATSTFTVLAIITVFAVSAFATQAHLTDDSLNTLLAAIVWPLHRAGSLLSHLGFRHLGSSLQHLVKASPKKPIKTAYPAPPIVHVPRHVQLSEAGHAAYTAALKEHGGVVGIPRHGRLEYIVDHQYVKDVLTDANNYSFEQAVTSVLHMEFMLWFKGGTFVQELEKLVQDGVTPRLRGVVEKIAPIFAQEAHELFEKHAGEETPDEVLIDDMYTWIHRGIARAMVVLILGERYLNEEMTGRFMRIVVGIAHLSGIYENTQSWARYPRLHALKTTLAVIFGTVIPDFFFGIVPQLWRNVDSHINHGLDVESSDYAPFLDILTAKHRNRATGDISFFNFMWSAIVCLGIIFASVHQSAVMAVWCVMTLAKRRDYQDELREEIAEIIEIDAEGNKCITLEGLRQAQKLDSFIREVLRTNGALFAPVRCTTAPVRIGPYVIPKGVNVMPYVKRANESVEAYGEKGTTFDGRQWVGNRPAVQSDPAFITFGLGRWACPGRHLAVAELKMIVATLFEAYDVSLVGDTFRSGDPMNNTSVAPIGTVRFRKLCT
ncbi:Cytochrome P450 CYP4/CYP19/CYP26 subfamilies [Ceraceosorus bombacis]|uniref:Cytochrome P450 CYP4/CYP19/CYP26 subfamilies n=1 Tax=Ceraceosorus bombacis TaxID=401625 RepID=A0A0P1BEA7_9BASI|nr:Cytochrome P450 CYP4/CYP19/CYP26 subfamilies [Ceraceosorus bombacis]